MAWMPDNMVIKGAQGTLNERIAYGQANAVYPKHCLMTFSDAATERYSFPGALPTPRLMLGGRQYQGMLDFSFTMENQTHELSVIVNRTHFEDDQTKLVMAKFTEIGDAWVAYKDSLFTTLLTNGNVAGNTAFDGVVFHGGSRTIGSSGTINNSQTSAGTAGDPTTAQVLTMLSANYGVMMRYQDDQGRAGFAMNAMSDLRLIIPPTHVKSTTEALSSTFISQTDNVWGRGLAKIDILPFLTGNTEVWFDACGSATCKPFVYQERGPLEVVILTDQASLAQYEGVKVLCRQRFRFGYGDPRLSILHTYS